LIEPGFRLFFLLYPESSEDGVSSHASLIELATRRVYIKIPGAKIQSFDLICESYLSYSRLIGLRHVRIGRSNFENGFVQGAPPLVRRLSFQLLLVSETHPRSTF